MISAGPWQIDFSTPWLVLLSVLLLLSLLLSLRAVTLRLYRRNPMRMLTVTLLNLIAYTAVYLLLLEPRLVQDREQSVTLLTEGADPLSRHAGNTASLYVAPGFDTSASSVEDLQDANWLLDIEQLELREPALNTIEVHGFGLSRDQWRRFSNRLSIDFSPPAISGFTGMRWQRYLDEGETLQISGHYQQDNSDSIVQLRLLDPASNPVDEQRLKSGQSFSMATTVKTRGNLEYTLQAWNDNVLESEQTVPVEAGSDAGLNIMIEQSAPSFETRQLQNYAAATGNSLRINTNISKDKSISQSINLPVDTNTTFSPQVLAEQDLLIMDGRALADLTPGQKQWLSDAVDTGLGLLVLADSALLESFSGLKTNLLSGFRLTPLAAAEPELIPRLITDNSINWQVPLTIAAMQLEADGADVLIDNGQNRNLVVRRAKDLGSIAISLISHSHNWLTAGYRKDWEAYWSALFNALARQRSGSFLLPQPELDFYRMNLRAEVCAFIGNEGSNTVINMVAPGDQQASFELDLATDELSSPRQCAYFWPVNSGWHQLQLLSAKRDTILDQKSIYVFGAGQWLAQHRKQRVQSTRAMAAGSSTPLPPTANQQLSEPISPFWPWLMLVLSCTILWLERKLDFG